MQPGWRMSQGQRGEPCRCDGEVLIHLRELEALEVIHAQVGHAGSTRGERCVGCAWLVPHLALSWENGPPTALSDLIGRLFAVASSVKLPDWAKPDQD